MRKNLMNARKEKGLTQLQIAKELQISIRHYNSLEAGTSEGSMKVWKQLKKLLNCSIDYLLEQEVDIEKENPDGNQENQQQLNHSIKHYDK